MANIKLLAPYLAAALLGAAFLSTGSAHAQAVLVAPPPTHYSMDARNVDVISGIVVLSTTDASIGDPAAGNGMAYGRTYVGGGWRDTATGTVDNTSTGATVSFAGQSEAFTLSGATYTPTAGTGGMLARSGSTWTYIARDGTTAVFTVGGSRPDQVRGTRVASVTRPNGETLTYDYLTVLVPKFVGDTPSIAVTRLETVTSNLGYQLAFSYAENDPPSQGSIPLFTQIDYASIINLASGGDQTASYSSGAVTREGITTTYGFSANGLTSIRRPTSTVNDIVITYDGSGRVATWADNGNTWTYTYSTTGSTRTTTITSPLGQVETYLSDTTTNRLTSYKDALNHTTSYQYDSFGRVTRVTLPEGNYVQYAYDARGNVTTTTNVAKTGSGLANIATSAAYPSTCANPATCNQPTSTTDPLGRVTTYTYDATHGGPLTITEPAPSGTIPPAPPQTRFTYQSLYAWYGGSQAPTPVTQLTQVSRCVTGSSCAGTADEIRTTIGYGAAGVANNRWPVQVSEGSGDGVLTATTTVAYTPDGDIQSVDGPLAGTSDTTTYRYDALRRMVGVVGPDPDDAGPLKRRAIRNTYNQDSQVIIAEQGTVEGLSNPDWTAFASLQQVSTTYDTWGRPALTEATGDGGVFALQQASYDAVGRLDCAATRMNPPVFDTPPVSACTAGTGGSFGPDRITRNAYDAASRLTSVTTGYGIAGSITETAIYSNNNQPLTLTDGEGNVSTLVYDGFDRMTRLRYPNPSGGGSSTTDYDNYTFDAASNVTVYRNRGGDSFTTNYDALNRPTLVDAPSGSNDVAYTYDNLGRVLTAVSGGQTLTYVWDALGRQTSETGPLGTTASQYDLAGRRTRLTWPGTPAFYVQYDFDRANDLIAIRENGASSGAGVLATYAYDNLGRRTGATWGNSATSSWGYDAVSRLTSLTHDLASSASDLTLGFDYNPADQIVGRTVSNAAYAWTPIDGTQAYVNNGRNQVTSADGAAVTYDGRQNIAAVGSATYGYNAYNELISANPGTAATLAYDPAGRLYQAEGAATTRFLYDGAQAIAEYDGAGTFQRRFVPGFALDETVASYEGTGTTDRRWLYADERGSVVVVANASAAALAINTYDEYGVPGSSNAGRFQYTGQMWLPEAGLYHYKARAYAPQLGRFMQTDPIGYASGANVYAYVGGDPINLIDPSGMVAGWHCETQPTPGPYGTVVEVCRYISDSSVQASGFGWQPCGRVCRDALSGGWGSGAGGNGFGYMPPFNPVQNDPQFAPYQEERLQQIRANSAPVYILMAVFAAPAAIEAGLFRTVACNCFEVDTIVTTDGGPRSIQNIAVGDLVLSRDEQTGETAFKPVVALIDGAERQIWEVAVETVDAEGAARRETIGTTDEHPWRLVGGDWATTAELYPGAELVTASGDRAVVVSVTLTDRTASTFNLEVEGFHTYFVGESALWVHNTCGQGPRFFTGALRRQIMKPGARCTYCINPATQADHIVAYARGGTTTLRNGTPACASCNASKGAEDVFTWLLRRAGF